MKYFLIGTLSALAICAVIQSLGQETTLANTPAKAMSMPAIQQVESTGVGITEDEAFKQAVVDAVRQVVGTLVSAENVISNDKLIKDEVLTLSNGFVEQVIKQEKSKTVNGAWNVKLRCVVRKGQVYDVLQKANVPTTKVDGISLFATAVSQSAFKKDSRKVVSKAVRDFFRVYPSIYNFDLQNPELVGGDDKISMVNIKYHCRVDTDLYWKQVLPPLQLALKSVSKNESRMQEYNYDSFKNFREDRFKKVGIKERSEWVFFDIESEILEGIDLRAAFRKTPGPNHHNLIHDGCNVLLFYNINVATPIFASVVYGDQYSRSLTYVEVPEPPQLKDGTAKIEIPTDLLPGIAKMTMRRGLDVTYFVNESSLFDDTGKPFCVDGWFVYFVYVPGQRKAVVRKGVPSPKEYGNEPLYYIGETLD